MRGIATSIAALAIGAVLGLALAETLVRVVAPQPFTPLIAGFGPENMVELDPRYGWKLVAGIRWRWQGNTTIEINSLGLRDREYGPKGADEIRILSLGDSFAFGAGVELDETYAKVLEHKLRERFPQLPISVINAGVAGYGQRQEILAFADLRPVIDPDIVLATFVAANDAENNAKFDDQLRDRIKNPVGFVGRHSHAVRLVLKTAYPVTDALMNRNPRHIAHTIDLLRQLEQDFTVAHVPYLMVVIPARHQLRPNSQVWSRVLLQLGFEGFLFRQNRMVIDHFVREQIPYVDTQPSLAARDRRESVVFDNDSHTNAIGHETIADAILEQVATLVREAARQRTLATP